MNETETNKSEERTSSEEEGRRFKKKKTQRKTTGQMIQEALGLSPEEIQDIEDKLFISRFLDYFSEETLDFIHNDRNLDQYLKRMIEKIEKLPGGNEEDKLLKMSFDEKKILETISRLKTRAEELAESKGIKTSVNKRLRNLNLIVTIPLLAVIVVLMFFPIDILFLFPILCVFCMVPQILRSTVLKKWLRFKEENKSEIYTQNREDIMILKTFVNETLGNIRTKLLELKVPLQLIKFSLYSRDYENINLINQRTFRGVSQFYFTFQYPEGMEPFPIPENLQQYEKPISPEEERSYEKNFIVLTELKADEGVIINFVPTLKKDLAEKINQMLNESEFSKSPRDFNEVLPNYSEEMGIFCVCGELAQFIDVQICNWKNQFKYYLFQGKECNCGETVYALSLMDEKADIPEELKEIFQS